MFGSSTLTFGHFMVASLLFIHHCIGVATPNPDQHRRRQDPDAVDQLVNEVVTEYITGFNRGGDGVIARRTPECPHSFALSDGGTAIPTIQGRDAYRDFEGIIRKYVADMSIMDIQPNRHSRRMGVNPAELDVTLSFIGSGIIITENDARGTPYNNAYVITLTIQLDSRNISAVHEVFDAPLTKRFLATTGLTIKCLLVDGCDECVKTKACLA